MPEANDGRGRFIVLEGAEGVGKTTQAGLLAEFLKQRGTRVVTTREPGGTAVGERIRRLLLHSADAKIDPATELLLILAARAAFVRTLVRPALEAGTWVVSDRFDMSTFAYQGIGRGIPRQRIEPLNGYATGGLTPDLCLVLDLPAREGRRRQDRQGTSPDRIESEGLAFLRKVRRAYLELAEFRQDAVLVPATGTVAEVQDRIRKEVCKRFPEPRIARTTSRTGARAGKG